jgi:transposase
MPGQNLNGKKARALEALLSGKSVEEAAQLAGVSRTTLFRWLREDERFRDEYRRAGSQLMEGALRRLQQLCGVAVKTLAEVMGEREATAASRVTAARATLELTLKIEEHRSLVNRLERLETSLGKR